MIWADNSNKEISDIIKFSERLRDLNLNNRSMGYSGKCSKKEKQTVQELINYYKW